MDTNTILGYVVKNNCGQYVHHTSEGNTVSYEKPAPISRGDAFRRLAAFSDENPDTDLDGFYTAPVFYQPSPTERAGAELGGLLESLCSRHGVQLGLTRAEINAKLARELEELSAGGRAGLLAGIPR